MSTVRVMVGLQNLEGRLVNTLRIGELAARRPQPQYRTECERCGTRSVATQTAITSGTARCLAAGCGRPVHGNETARQFRAQIEADEDARRLETEAREREAADKARAERFEERKRKSREYIRQQVLTGVDSQLYLSPGLLGVSLPEADADRYNAEQAAIFAKETPEYAQYRSEASLTAIGSYFERNGVGIADAAMIRAAFFRLRDLGIIQPRPAAPPAEVVPAKPVVTPNLTIARPASPQMFRGIDPETGLEREYTKRQVDGMSAHEYKRCFPTVGTMAELLTLMREQRSNA